MSQPLHQRISVPARNFACGLSLAAGLVIGPLNASADPEVLIYGATPGGVAAAVAAAKGGHEVLLSEPTARLGGMPTCGLTHSDFRSFEALTGFFLGFSERVLAHYRPAYGGDSPQVRESWRGTHGEPSVNLRVIEGMIAERPEIRVLKPHQLKSARTGPFKLGRRRLVSADFTKPDGGLASYTAQLFINGSYEGGNMF